MLIVTPNPAVDHTVRLARLRLGEVVRARSGVSVAGGKGGNVARAAHLLGTAASVLAFVPETGGEHLRALYTAENIALTGVPLPGRVRTCTAIITDDAQVTLINEPGAEIGEADWGRLMEALRAHLAAPESPESPAIRRSAHDLVVCSGSLPPGAPQDGYAQIVQAGHDAGREVIVDAGAGPLARAIEVGADLVCPNVSEAEAMLCGELAGAGVEAPGAAAELVDDDGADVPRRAAAAAAALVRRGARWAAVTAGSAGAALVGPGISVWLAAPKVKARNPIGAGDSFLAGVATARLAGRDWPGAVRRGLAAGSASVEQDGAGVVDPARVDELERAAAGPS